MSWEERMSAKAKARRAVQEAEEIARMEAALPALPGEGDVNGPGLLHAGHRWHWHQTHGNTFMCSCGQRSGAFSVVIDPDEPPIEPDERCPVCETRGIAPGRTGQSTNLV